MGCNDQGAFVPVRMTAPVLPICAQGALHAERLAPSRDSGHAEVAADDRHGPVLEPLGAVQGANRDAVNVRQAVAIDVLAEQPPRAASV
jgi:hypothetical protein